MIIRSIAVLAGLAFLASGNPSSVYAQNEIAAQTNLANLIDPEVSGVETAILAQAPNVPSPIKRKFATKVIVNLEVREVTRKGKGSVPHNRILLFSSLLPQ
jgi:nitrite reductase (NO-forming)